MITKLPEKWLAKAGLGGRPDHVNHWLVDCADELEAALPKWTKITEDEATLPPEGEYVIGYSPYKTQEIALCELLMRPDGRMWTFGATTSHADILPKNAPTHWRPLCDIDTPETNK